MKIFFAAAPLIYLITDGNATIENYAARKNSILKLIKIAVETEINLIQLREKQLPARLIYELAVEAAGLTRPSRTALLVNDRADIALAANADGVHLTATSLAAKIVRRNFPENFIVGVSAHTLAEVAAAKREAADFATFSPIYSSPGKGAPQGLEKLREVCAQVENFPIIALGGIDETNFREVLQTGASGFAAIRFLNAEKNLKTLAANLHGAEIKK